MTGDNDVVKEFLVESYENLDRLDRDLLELEKDPTAQEILASIFRTIHTIKGTCGFLGFSHLEKVAHVGENLLSRLREGLLQFDGEPKSPASKKPVVLHPLVMGLLKHWREITTYAGEDDLIFASDRLKGMFPRVPNMLVEDHLRPAAERVMDIPEGHRFGFHNLRSRPVISTGLAIPSIPRIVGATSSSVPSSRIAMVVDRSSIK